MDLRAARAAAGAGATRLADVLDGASAIGDGGVDVSVGGDLAEADVHEGELKVVFKSKRVKDDLKLVIEFKKT